MYGNYFLRMRLNCNSRNSMKNRLVKKNRIDMYDKCPIKMFVIGSPLRLVGQFV